MAGDAAEMIGMLVRDHDLGGALHRGHDLLPCRVLEGIAAGRRLVHAAILGAVDQQIATVGPQHLKDDVRHLDGLPALAGHHQLPWQARRRDLFDPHLDGQLARSAERERAQLRQIEVVARDLGDGLAVQEITARKQRGCGP